MITRTNEEPDEDKFQLVATVSKCHGKAWLDDEYDQGHDAWDSLNKCLKAYEAAWQEIVVERVSFGLYRVWTPL